MYYTLKFLKKFQFLRIDITFELQNQFSTSVLKQYKYLNLVNSMNN